MHNQATKCAVGCQSAAWDGTAAHSVCSSAPPAAMAIVSRAPPLAPGVLSAAPAAGREPSRGRGWYWRHADTVTSCVSLSSAAWSWCNWLAA